MKLKKWEDLRGRFNNSLLLGNGASIAVHERFDYGSLYEEACKSGALDDNLQQLFKDFDINDFEFVLRLLSYAKAVNNSLGIEEDKTTQKYDGIKEALIKTVHTFHPKYDEVEKYLDQMASYMWDFKNIVSLNYDLLVYWAMLKGNDWVPQDKKFKDCFIGPSFQSDFDYLRGRADQSEEATLVFYPHGNLVLATDPFGDECKLRRGSDDVYLLDAILSEWRVGNCDPLFVSEGNTKQKRRAIDRSHYLTNVYGRVLATLKESLVIYGWSGRSHSQSAGTGITGKSRHISPH